MAKNISKYLAGVSAVSLLMNLFAPVFSLVSAVDPVSANQDVVFNVNIAKILTVSVTTPGTSAEIDKVTGSGNANEFMTTSFQLNVATNNLTGYKATMTTNSSSTVLQHATSTSDTIANLTGPATGGTTFPANFWGFSLDDSTYNSLKPKGDSNAPIVASSEGPAEDSQRIYFGMKADGTKPSGDYSNTVLLTVVTNSVPEPSLCGSTPTMQNIANLKSTLFENNNTQVELCDERDGKHYYASKLADGNIWMTQNLDLELSTSTALTPNDSDVSSNWTPNRSTQDHQYKTASGTTDSNAIWNNDYNTIDHSYRPASDVAAGTSGDYGNDGDTYFSPAFMQNGTTMANWKTTKDCTDAGNSAELCAHWNVGTFYSWRAATAGTGNGDITTDGANATASICPKGWKLPTGASSGDFQKLVTDAGITASNIMAAPFYFLRSGRYVGLYGAVYNTGGRGYYWSATSGGSGRAYYLYFYSGTIGPSGDDVRYLGMCVRCLARADNSGGGDNPSNNGANSASTFAAARPPASSSTESTSSDSSDSYAKPQGVFDETDHDESINATNPAASAALGATAVVAAGVIFFVLAKRREDDDDEQQA